MEYHSSAYARVNKEELTTRRPAAARTESRPFDSIRATR